MQRSYVTGEIYWFNLNGLGHVQTGWHPGVIVQNNVGNKHSTTISIVPITSSRCKVDLPTHVKVKKGTGGLPRDSVIQCEGQQIVSKEMQIGEYIGRFDHKIMAKVAKGCLINTPFLDYLSDQDIARLKGGW